VRIIAAVAFCLVTNILVPASAAQAEVPTQLTMAHFYRQQPAPTPETDPRTEVQELQQQISELHDSWDSITPDQRSARIAELQKQVTAVDQHIHNLPPEQQQEVEAMLLWSTIQLFDLLRMAQASQPQPCVLFVCPPPRG
jgi:peptidoglycan hydrolase CwlO-like protein